MARVILMLILLALPGTVRAENLEYCKKGVGAANAGDLDLAISHYTLCITNGDLTNDNLAQAFNYRGRMYADQGKYNKAIADYDRAIELKPDYAYYFNERGYTFFLKGEYDRAIQDHTAALRIKPNFVVAYNYRGNAYKKTGLYERAIADYEQAIRLQPDGAYAHQSLAWLLATASDGRYRDGARAVRLAKRAVARAFKVPYNHGALAAAYAEVGQFDDAVAEQDRAIEMLRLVGRHDEVADFQTRLDLYRRRQPYRERLTAPAQGGWDEGWDAYKSRDYATATREFIALAEQGDARAQATFSIMLVFDEVVLDAGGPWNLEKLHLKVEKWFFKPDASNKQNLNEAEKWFRNAANKGDTKAWTLLGHMYDSLGVLYYFFGQSAPGGTMVVEGGVVHVYGRYRDCCGVPKGLDEAMKLWLKAAEQGEVTAQKSLAFVLGFQNKSTESANWTRKAAEQGDRWGQRHLAR